MLYMRCVGADDLQLMHSMAMKGLYRSSPPFPGEAHSEAVQVSMGSLNGCRSHCPQFVLSFHTSADWTVSSLQTRVHRWSSRSIWQHMDNRFSKLFINESLNMAMALSGENRTKKKMSTDVNIGDWKSHKVGNSHFCHNKITTTHL